MKKIKGILAVMLLLGVMTCPIRAEEESNPDRYIENGFQDVDIVTEDTYQPINPEVSEMMKDAAMGDNPENIHLYQRSRASAPYWKTENGLKNFYDAEGNLMYRKGTKLVIDVSEHNGKINWEQVKAAGVDGAIIRVGFGYLGEDAYFQYNVNECNRLGIPYGIYLYSYAYDANFAYAEANGTAEMLSKVSLNLSYPIYYDIEGFKAWNDNGTTRKHPTTPAEYEKVIGTYINRMNQLGYSGLVHVYSYRSYLQNELNSVKILPYVSWTAAYTQTLGFDNPYYNGEEGWQYTSSGSVKGISGKVDMNCFSNQFYNTSLSTTVPASIQNALTSSGARFSAGYISGMSIGTDLTKLTKSLASVGSVTCFNKNGSVVNGGRIATGQKIVITLTGENAGTYTIMVVVKGDVDGDGQIRSIDYALVKNDILNIKKLSGAFLKAGDVYGDGKIRSIDYSLIKNDILNIKKITQ